MVAWGHHPATGRVACSPMRIEGAGALVAGGASGLGEATARELAARGARVAIADLNEERGRALAEELGGVFATADVTDEGAVQAAVDTAVEAFGGLRLAVSCAGIGWAERTVGKRRRGRARAVRDRRAGEPDRHLQRAAARGRGDGRQRARRRGRARRGRDDCLDRRLRRPDRPDRLRGLEGRRRRADAARGTRPRAPGHPRLHDRARASSTRRCSPRCPSRRAGALGEQMPFPPRLGRPAEYAALACQIAENTMLNGEVIRLDGALRMAPR